MLTCDRTVLEARLEQASLLKKVRDFSVLPAPLLFD